VLITARSILDERDQGMIVHEKLKALLLLRNGCFGLFFNRDVICDTGDAIDFAVSVVNRKTPIANPAARAVRKDDSVLLIVQSIPVVRGRCSDSRAVLGINGFDP